MKIKLMYKIHGLRTAQGLSRSANTPKFYRTQEEAIESARKLIHAGCHDHCDDLVIYKAFMLVCKEQPPIQVKAIEYDGEVVELGLDAGLT